MVGFACVVSALVFAGGGVHVWFCVGLEVWRWSLPSTAAAARILHRCVCTWCTCLSVAGRGYFRGELRPTRPRILLDGMVAAGEGCCGLEGGLFPVAGPAWMYVWAWGCSRSGALVLQLPSAP